VVVDGAGSTERIPGKTKPGDGAISFGQQYSSGGEPYSIETVLSLAPKLQSGSSVDRFLQTAGTGSSSL
jgi:hypothetical protein